MNTLKSNNDLVNIIDNNFSNSLLNEKIKSYHFHPSGVHYLVL